jgi:hypothetical protein
MLKCWIRPENVELLDQTPSGFSGARNLVAEEENQIDAGALDAALADAVGGA